MRHGNRWWLNCIKVLIVATVGGLCASQTLSIALQAQDFSGGIEVQDSIVRFAKEIEVPALETGRVVRVQVRPNDYITKGGPIASLDDRTLLIRRKSAQIRLNTAKSDAESDVEFKFAQTALKQARSELSINRNIQKEHGGSVARNRVQELELAVERGVLEVARAEQRMQRAIDDFALQGAEVAIIDDQLRNLHSDSPMNGVVLEVHKSPGEWIQKGSSLATIAQIDRLHVHAFMSNQQISPAACKNLPVSVHWLDPTTQQKRTLSGRVLSVDPQVLPGSRFRLHAEITNQLDATNRSRWMLNPGAEVRMFVHAQTAALPTDDKVNR